MRSSHPQRAQGYVADVYFYRRIGQMSIIALGDRRSHGYFSSLVLRAQHSGVQSGIKCQIDKGDQPNKKPAQQGQSGFRIFRPSLASIYRAPCNLSSNRRCLCITMPDNRLSVQVLSVEGSNRKHDIHNMTILHCV